MQNLESIVQDYIDLTNKNIDWITEELKKPEIKKQPTCLQELRVRSSYQKRTLDELLEKTKSAQRMFEMLNINEDKIMVSKNGEI